MKLIVVLAFFLTSNIANCQVVLYVSKKGNDTNNGSLIKPLGSLSAAVSKAIAYQNKEVTIVLRQGVYFMESTIVINSVDYHLKSLHITTYKNEQVTLSGGLPIKPKWTFYKNGIYKANIHFNTAPDRLFLFDKSLPMARYPNFDSTARIYNGVAEDAFSKERIAGWQHPEGGYLHALHSGEWGSFDYLITGKDDKGNATLEGGWQNNRPAPLNKKFRFVENIFEELNAPGEWYYDKKLQTLYVYPPVKTNINKADFFISKLNNLLVVKGSVNNPVKNITIDNICFTETNRTFMLTKERLLRSDWSIYRGGAILLDGTENVTVRNCIFKNLGGNAVFISNYGRNDLISDNHIFNIGGNAICFVGNPDAVRSPSFNYDSSIAWREMDFTAGSKSVNYPENCSATGNLIHNIGFIEKQVAGVAIAMAKDITVAHNTIYGTPRAGINIGDGCWGGDVLEFNDVFNTVMETGDNGAFNSWGRDRFWSPDRAIIDSIVTARPGIEFLDIIKPNIIRNNRFQCDHGWDIDLDDGSSNYQIYNNVCLSGGLKLREGYHRTVTNNIIINNTFHPHVWLKNSDDVFKHNIVTTPYAPIAIDNWGKNIDDNFFLSEDGLKKSQALGNDKNSLWGNALFIDADKNNYHLKDNSPAYKIGFKNFNMNVGVTNSSLKKLAMQPAFKSLQMVTTATKGTSILWLGAKLKNIETLGERSAAGLLNYNGALITSQPAASIAAKNKLQNGDVIIKLGDEPVNSTKDLLQIYQKLKWMHVVDCIIMHNQHEQLIKINFEEL